VKGLVELCVEGANILDLCVEGDKLIEEGTGAVYNKSVKGVKVSKGSHPSFVSTRYPKPDDRFWFTFNTTIPSLPPNCAGLAFPTCISVNNCVAHFSPLA
jgi:methionine aminopeptidase